MRIVGGIYRGRKLAEFKGEDVRPTSDMVRESLFNILRYKIGDADFLDLFSGTGAMGIEALSRGANYVTFNDSAKSSIKILSENLGKLGVPYEKYEVTNYDALTFIEKCRRTYDVVYLDPPYALDVGVKALKVIDKILSPEGIAVYENEKPFAEELDNLEKYDERKYGRVYVTFFRKRI